MTHPLFTYLTVPSPAEARERRHELDWLFEMPAPRKPRDKRQPPPRPELTERERRVLGVEPEDE